MNTVEWQSYSFKQLNTLQLYDILKLRVNVFVVEQHCPYPELDDNDTHPKTIHLLAYRTENLIAYARLLPPGSVHTEASIGRIVVQETERRKGLGSLLVKKSINEVNRQWQDMDIKISAQAYLQNFYEQLGFKKVSEVYLEDDIPHIAMVKEYHAT